MGCMCSRCHGTMKLVTGVLLLVNARLWPKWVGLDGWVQFVAVLFILGGLVKLLVPNKCANCAAMQGMPASKGKKR